MPATATTQPANPAKKQDTPLQEPPMRFDIIRLSSTACEPLCPEWISADGELTDQSPAKLTKLLPTLLIANFQFCSTLQGARSIPQWKWGV